MATGAAFNGITRRLDIMDERFFLKLLLVLFAGLIAAELFVVTVFGLRLELILLCFIIAAALTGIVIVARLLLEEQPDIESVSMRRERQKRAGIMQERLREYDVDHEFTGAKRSRIAKGRVLEPSQSVSSGSGETLAPPTPVSLDEVIRAYAEMYGGFRSMLQVLNQLDDGAFGRLMAKAGLGTLCREKVIHKITQMAEEERQPDIAGSAGEEEAPISGISLDKASFDEYIRRSMTSGEKEQEGADSGFSVELDSDALSRGTGTMPSDFSHDPKAVFAKLKKPGTPS